MTKPRIRAVTFDLWDTIFIDDSDEPKREHKGLAPKPLERINLVKKFIEKQSPVSGEVVETAYQVIDTAFRHVWYQQNTTWTVQERLSILLKGLGIKLPEKEFSELIRLHEEMELFIQPDLAPGIADALAEIHGKYRLGVISDTIFSPGRVLRKILQEYDLLKYFDSLIFSDEVGCAKPTASVFKVAAHELQVELSEVAHVGDREEKDIAGPQALGAKAVLTTVVKDRGSLDSKAEAICKDYRYLATILENLP